MPEFTCQKRSDIKKIKTAHERLLCDACIPLFPKPYKRTRTSTLSLLKQAKQCSMEGFPALTELPVRGVSTGVGQNRGHLVSCFSLESRSFLRLGETFVLFLFLS